MRDGDAAKAAKGVEGGEHSVGGSSELHFEDEDGVFGVGKEVGGIDGRSKNVNLTKATDKDALLNEYDGRPKTDEPTRIARESDRSPVKKLKDKKDKRKNTEALRSRGQSESASRKRPKHVSPNDDQTALEATKKESSPQGKRGTVDQVSTGVNPRKKLNRDLGSSSQTAFGGHKTEGENVTKADTRTRRKKSKWRRRKDSVT